jgi:hypothetical protein
MTRIVSVLLVLLGACALTFGIAELRAERGGSAIDPSMSAAIPPAAAATAGQMAQDAPAGGSAAPAPASAPATAPTADDVRALWRRGEYAAAGVLGLFLLLAVALKVDPRRAFYYTAGLGALGAVVELIALGQTPNVGMLVGAVAVFGAIVTRSPLPRPPERGSAASPLLVILAGGALTVAAMGAWSCTPARHVTRATASDLVDCTTSTARAHAAEYGSLLEAAIRAATSPEVQVDKAALKGAVSGLALETGWCAAELTVARTLSSFPALRVAPGGYDPAAGLREAWEAVRGERWEGKRFRVGEGPVL